MVREQSRTSAGVEQVGDRLRYSSVSDEIHGVFRLVTPTGALCRRKVLRAGFAAAQDDSFYI
jgi:hypothetical protein